MILAIDYDGTIADTNVEKVKWIRRELDMEILPWQCNRTECAPRIGVEAYQEMGDCVYEREGTLQAAEVPGALDAIRALSGRAELHVVSVRPATRLEFAREWLACAGVLALFQAFHGAYGTPKADICRALGARALIDDDSRHLARVDVPGLARVLLQHGRSESPTLGVGMVFFRAWDEVVRYVGGLGV